MSPETEGAIEDGELSKDQILELLSDDKPDEKDDEKLDLKEEDTEDDKEEHLHCSALYETFKYWFKYNNPNIKIPSNKEFVTNLRKYKTVERVYVGSVQQLGVKKMRITSV